jgi:hypothetical protein
MSMGPKNEEEWLIATSDETPIPTCHDMTAVGLKLRPQSAMKVQLAIRVPVKNTKEPQSYLFSTLRLPKSTSTFILDLPFPLIDNQSYLIQQTVAIIGIQRHRSMFGYWSTLSHPFTFLRLNTSSARPAIHQAIDLIIGTGGFLVHLTKFPLSLKRPFVNYYLTLIILSSNLLPKNGSLSEIVYSRGVNRLILGLSFAH